MLVLGGALCGGFRWAFSQLLMHVPAHPLLQRLGKLARRHVQVCSALKGLQGYVGMAAARSSLPSRPLPPYSVDYVDL